jgi:hypothetical protein
LAFFAGEKGGEKRPSLLAKREAGLLAKREAGICFLAWLAMPPFRPNAQARAADGRPLAAEATASASPMSPILRHPLPTYL